MVQELQILISGEGNIMINKTRELIASTTIIVARLGTISQETGTILMDIYTKTLNKQFTNAIHEEAMIAMGDIAMIIGSRFTDYLPKVSHIIQIGLNDGYLHPNLCRAAICVLGDIAIACNLFL
jgi:hypothetical protein